MGNEWKTGFCIFFSQRDPWKIFLQTQAELTQHNAGKASAPNVVLALSEDIIGGEDPLQGTENKKIPFNDHFTTRGNEKILFSQFNETKAKRNKSEERVWWEKNAPGNLFFSVSTMAMVGDKDMVGDLMWCKLNMWKWSSDDGVASRIKQHKKWREKKFLCVTCTPAEQISK